MSTLLQIDAAGPYESRVEALRQHAIALWDVLKSCTRESSLDSDVVESSIVVNELSEFLRNHPRIHTVCFNGAKAEGIYRKHALPGLTRIGDLTYHRLPSTSPANASMLYARKLAAWRAALSAG